MTEQEFIMPKMGESITEGTILNWLVAEGESFNEGDILCEVATDKVDNEVPAPASGVMLKQLASPKDVIAVGAPIALLNLEAVVGSPVKKTSAAKAADSPVKKSAKKERQLKQGAQVKVNSNVFVSPLIEAIAREHHISFDELARIPATGTGGRLRKSDVTDYIADGRPYKFAQAVAESGFKVPDLQFDKGQG